MNLILGQSEGILTYDSVTISTVGKAIVYIEKVKRENRQMLPCEPINALKGIPKET